MASSGVVPMAALVAPVAAFVRVINAAHTQELLRWTMESLERAFAWANAMESLAEKVAKDGSDATRALQDALAQQLQHAALPVMAHAESLSIFHLRDATRIVSDAVLTSPWLLMHPLRSHFVACALQKRLQLPAPRDASHSLPELVMDHVHTHRSMHAAEKLSNQIRHGMKRRRVQVLSAAFEIPSLTSYTLQPRTQRLRALARTLQRNLCAARALTPADDAIYKDLLARLASQLKQAQPDVVEVIVWSAVMDWPSADASSPLGDVLQLVDRWVESQPMQMLLSVAPWPTALLAGASSVFARHYVIGLFRTRLHKLAHDELRCRIGALALQSSGLQDIVQAELLALDQYTREQLLSDLAK